VQHVLLQAYGRLLLKCDVWDAFATLLDECPTLPIAIADMSPGDNNHNEFRVEENRRKREKIK